MDEKEENLQLANRQIQETWKDAPKGAIKPSVHLLLFQNKWYGVVEDSTSIYLVASRDKQILAVARQKVKKYQKYGVPIYYVEDSLNSPISPLKIISCSQIKNEKQKFVIEKIVPYL